MSSRDFLPTIVEFISGLLDSPKNSADGHGNGRVWNGILLGAAHGDDPIFEKFKEAVDARHYTPAELFKSAFPQIPAKAGEISVLCWILPQRAAVREANRRSEGLPSKSWGRAKVRGEIFYNFMGAELEKFFTARGMPAVYPMGHPEIVRRAASQKYYEICTWSERHACHAAGLGTFGLCDGLITPYGKAHRCGSIILKGRLPATPRNYSSFHDYCPWFSKKCACGLCMRRCPAGALNASGHDKKLCKSYLHGHALDFFKSCGFSVYACGLCQTGVPCEDRIPGRAPMALRRGFLGGPSLPAAPEE